MSIHSILRYLSHLICAHQRLSAILVVNRSTFHGRSTALTGLQYQFTGYSYNLVGVVSPISHGVRIVPPHLIYSTLFKIPLASLGY